jgi:hypothetical protein
MSTTHLFPIFVRQGKNRSRFKVGYIDEKGVTIIEPIFDDGTRFYEGLASVRVRNRWGVLDTSGQFVIQPKVWSWCVFEDGVASISVKGRWGVIDNKGEFVVEPKYSFMGWFRNGFAAFRTGDRREQWRYGFVDRGGVEVVPPVFRDVTGFSEGLAAAKLGDLWGYINTQGVFKITARFEGTRQGKHGPEETTAGYFIDGMAPVYVNQGYGFIDNTGTVIIDGRYEEAESFHDGLALIQRNGRHGFIDR